MLVQEPLGFVNNSVAPEAACHHVNGALRSRLPLSREKSDSAACRLTWKTVQLVEPALAVRERDEKKASLLLRQLLGQAGLDADP